MIFFGPVALGALALSEDDLSTRRAALDEAEAYLAADSVGHNYLNFYEDAMEACLRTEEWNEVERYAQALEDYTLAEPMPRSKFFVARGRTLADYGRGNRDGAVIQQLQRLHDDAERARLRPPILALEEALSSD